MQFDLSQLQSLRGSNPVQGVPRDRASTTGQPFEAFLEQATAQGPAPLRISGHAQRRLAGQEIKFSEADLSRIAGAVDQAASRGARESLVLFRNVGLVVNVGSRTILTSLDPSRMKAGVVTGIDSTVFVTEDP